MTCEAGVEKGVFIDMIYICIYRIEPAWAIGDRSSSPLQCSAMTCEAAFEELAFTQYCHNQ